MKKGSYQALSRSDIPNSSRKNSGCFSFGITTLYHLCFNSLHDAAEKGDEKLIRELIKLGFSVNKKDSAGNTPLIYATLHKHHECMRILLEEGNADPNIQASKGLRNDTPLILSTSFQDVMGVKLLLNHKADYKTIKNKDQFTAYKWATTHGYNQIVDLMINSENKNTPPKQQELPQGLTHRHSSLTNNQL